MPFKVNLSRSLAVAPLALVAALLLGGCGGLNETGENESGPSALTPPPGPANDGPHALEVRLGAHTHTTRLEFKTQPVQPIAGQLAIWSLKVMKINGFDTSDYVREFKFTNAELMHVTVVSRDLSYFATLDPDYKDYGHFLASSTLPYPGTYKLYADYMPHDGVEEIAQADIVVAPPEGYSGYAIERQAKLKPQAMSDGWLTQHVAARPVDAISPAPPDATNKAAYSVRLMPGTWPIRENQKCLLHFRVLDASGRPVADLQPYLGAMGHVAIVSADTNVFILAPPFDTSGRKRDPSGIPEMEGAIPANQRGPDVFFEAQFPAPGRYKMWAQFEHDGQVITAPFELEVGSGQIG